MDDPTPVVDSHSRPPRRFRRTRIAVSVFFGVLTLLILVLWARSYWRSDKIVSTGDAGTLALSTEQGRLTIEILNERVLLPEGWSHGSFPTYDDDSLSGDEPRTLLGFGWEMDHGSITVAVPFWILWILALTCAAFPWMHRRFSLRTLLAATTLVAVVLGLACYSLR
jgi:hypothetical protein